MLERAGWGIARGASAAGGVFLAANALAALAGNGLDASRIWLTPPALLPPATSAVVNVVAGLALVLFPLRPRGRGPRLAAGLALGWVLLCAGLQVRDTFAALGRGASAGTLPLPNGAAPALLVVAALSDLIRPPPRRPGIAVGALLFLAALPLPPCSPWDPSPARSRRTWPSSSAPGCTGTGPPPWPWRTGCAPAPSSG